MWISTATNHLHCYSLADSSKSAQDDVVMARHEAIPVLVLVRIALGLRGTGRREKKCLTGVCSVTVLDTNDAEKKQ